MFKLFEFLNYLSEESEDVDQKYHPGLLTNQGGYTLEYYDYLKFGSLEVKILKLDDSNNLSLVLLLVENSKYKSTIPKMISSDRKIALFAVGCPRSYEELDIFELFQIKPITEEFQSFGELSVSKYASIDHIMNFILPPRKKKFQPPEQKIAKGKKTGKSKEFKKSEKSSTKKSSIEHIFSSVDSSVPTERENPMIVSPEPDNSLIVPTGSDNPLIVPTGSDNHLIIPTEPYNSIAESKKSKPVLNAQTEGKVRKTAPVVSESALAEEYHDIESLEDANGERNSNSNTRRRISRGSDKVRKTAPVVSESAFAEGYPDIESVEDANGERNSNSNTRRRISRGSDIKREEM